MILSLRSKITAKAITTTDDEKDVASFLIGLYLFTCLIRLNVLKAELIFNSVWTVTFTNIRKYVTSFFLRSHVQMGGHQRN